MADEPQNPPSWMVELKAWATDLFTTKAGLGIIASVIAAIGGAWYAAKPVDTIGERQAVALEKNAALNQKIFEMMSQPQPDGSGKTEAAFKAMVDALDRINVTLATEPTPITPMLKKDDEKKKETEPFKFKD